jgi:hypothetical protein
MAGTGVTSAEATSSRLEELYVQHAPAGLRFAFYLSGDPERARDLVQDAFERVAGRFAHLRQPERFDLYLRRTIVNLHTSRLRRLRLERAYLAREAGSVAVAHEEPDPMQRDEVWHAIVAATSASRGGAPALRGHERARRGGDPPARPVVLLPFVIAMRIESVVFDQKGEPDRVLRSARVTVEMSVEPGRQPVESGLERIESRVDVIESGIHPRRKRVDPRAQVEQSPE